MGLNKIRLKFCVVLLLLVLPVSLGLFFPNSILEKEQDHSIFNLNYLTKIHVTDIKTITLSPCSDNLNYMKLQKEAVKLNITNSLNLTISYKRYSSADINILLNDISSCDTNSKSNQNALPDNTFDTVILNFENEAVKSQYITLYVEYDIPLETEFTKVFQNSFYFNKNRDNSILSIILPKGANLWSNSSGPNKIEESDNTLTLTWYNLEKPTLFITYGNTQEYLFYDAQVNLLLNDFMNIAIIVFTIVLSYAFYLKTTSYYRYVNRLFFLYGLFLLFIIAIFTWRPLLFGNLVQPFSQRFFLGLIYRGIIAFLILIITYLLVKNKKLIKLVT